MNRTDDARTNEPNLLNEPGDDERSTEQEVAGGTTETTPVWLIGGVGGAVALLVALALALAAIAYFLA